MRGRLAKDLSALNRTIGRYIAPVGLVLALLAATAETVAGPGSRLGLWYYRKGLVLLGIGAIAGALGAVISLIGGILAAAHRSAYRMAIAGIVIGLVAAGIPWSWSRTAKQVPKIHDISTDTVNPPRFSAVLPFRTNAENPAAYGGPDVAAQQSRAYPDIQPLVLSERPETVFNRAVKVAGDMGWDIAYMNAKEGRIEATAATFWFGFKDDVAVRITSVKEGSRIDVRSLSRVGVSDVGANAKRIRKFLEKMKTIRAKQQDPEDSYISEMTQLEVIERFDRRFQNSVGVTRSPAGTITRSSNSKTPCISRASTADGTAP
jgi:uncharacterized protein (DUF1499 family)